MFFSATLLATIIVFWIITKLPVLPLLASSVYSQPTIHYMIFCAELQWLPMLE